MKPKNTPPSSWKKGEHSSDVRRYCASKESDLPGRTGAAGSQDPPGTEWKAGSQRATFEPDPAAICGCCALEPATGQAASVFSDRRDSVSHIRLLEQVMIQFLADRWLLIEDNLSMHTSREVRVGFLAWPEVQIQFLPKYACWLNLIEPWWKQMHSLALKGHRFETIDELVAALEAALNY